MKQPDYLKRLAAGASDFLEQSGAGIEPAASDLLAERDALRDALRALLFAALNGAVLERDAVIGQARAALAGGEA